MHPPAGASAGFSQGGKKAASIRITAENILPPIAPVEHLIDRAIRFHPHFPSHQRSG